MKLGEPVIRRGDAHDVERITLLVNRAFEVEAFFVAGDRTTGEQIREKLATGVFFIAEKRDRLVGCVHVDRRDRVSAYISMLAVEPSQQGAGIGRQLMRVAEQYCLQGHCREVCITVINLRTDLQPFYRSLGYREHGTAPYSDAHRATRPVHFIVMKKALRRAASDGGAAR
ncbi:MAG: GNAT family N-acetyltransferase [Vicinamibacterales bacterium]